MKKNYGLVLIAVGLSACHHVYYAPNTANSPMFSEKGEVKVNALYASGGDSEFEGGELQVAYALTNHVGLMVNGFSAGKSEEVTSLNSASHTEEGSGSYAEVGAGYFKFLDVKKKLIAEVYGGIGTGSVENKYSGTDRSKVGLTKYFIQPAVGFKSGNFEIVLVPKMSFVSWKVKEDYVSLQENSDAKNAMAAIKANPNFFSLEPAFIIRAGSKNVKFQAGFSLSHYKPSAIYSYDELTETMNLNLGISINIKPQKR